MSKDEHSSLTMRAGLGAYMAYLLRYASYPVTIAGLKKLATAHRFQRLVHYLEKLPEDTVYYTPKDALEHFRRVSHL